MSTKIRKTLTLDDDLVELFAADDPASLSVAVNTVLRAESERRRARESISRLADDLDQQFGPPDPADVAYFEGLLA